MEVHGRQPNDRRLPAEKQAEQRLARLDRDRLGESTSATSETARDRAAEPVQGTPAGRDVLELSDAARLQWDTEADRVREERVAELRRAHAEGRLYTPDRLERAAENLLRG